jgi:hypothetical protein
MERPGRVEDKGERRVAYKVLMGKTEGRNPPGRHRHKREDIIKMDIQEIGCGLGLD